MEFEFTSIFFVTIALALGGVLKGATGAGAPVLAVPVLTMFFGVKFAVIVMLMPNLLTNIWQSWAYRASQPSRLFVWSFAIAGCVGVVIGTAMLVTFSQATLTILVAIAVFVYIALRLAKPDWKLELALAKLLSVPAGVAAGFLQGATGLSAPVSMTFINALKLDRAGFIASISVYFSFSTLPQIAALWYFGLLSWTNLAISLCAFGVISLFMPLGAALAKRLSRQAFDRLVLILLAVIGCKLLWDAVSHVA
ncbi:sulfite exporter TauE/SafE family protein [Aquamicrobium zhengzhouense]|uniref:sulfite exporter TauE/SafE family protein n=1 Tax=Aquamicrobium zhengzhouense TaxID=2781738 RepID=UPI0018E19B90|nr:sulfite exporter TauE/SafE family protein [Aquamicrobium zhengzhouense]